MAKEVGPKAGKATVKRSSTTANTGVAYEQKLVYRSRWVSGLFLLAFLLILVTLVRIQLVEGDSLAESAKKLRTKTVELTAHRGEITDRDGVVLAASVTKYNITADQTLVADWKDRKAGLAGVSGAAQLLAPALGMSEPEVAGLLYGDRRFVYVKKTVAPETWDAIKKLGISGIFAEEISERIYPAGETGGRIVGFIGSDGVGKLGVEANLDEELSGKPGKVTYERGRNNQVIPNGEKETIPAVPGHDVQTTLITDVQWKAQEALKAQLVATGAESGYVVVMDVKTGAIYALVDAHPIDPAAPTVFSETGAISEVFDPGSTAKVVTMAAVIEEGLATPISEYSVPYRYAVTPKMSFKDSHEHGVEKWTLAGILAESSNTGTVMVGKDLSVEQRYDYLKKFGFGQKTGIELKGESAGLLHDYQKWDGRTQYAVLFGQGMSSTAIQATNVLATIANGGKRPNVHLIEAVSDDTGNLVRRDSGVQTQVVSEQTADQVLLMMESVISEGSGGSGAINGFRVAGKTGTAQIPDETGALNGIMASFIGVAPAENPQIAVGVFLKNPKTSIYGGVTAAPVFSDVAGFVLQKLGVEPSTEPAPLYPVTWGEEAEEQ